MPRPRLPRALPRALPFTLALGLLAACTPSGNGGGGDCRDGDDPCASGFICAAVTANSYECRTPCNEGACPIGQTCDPFFDACIPGDAPPATDRGLSMDAGPGADLGAGDDAGPGQDADVARDAAGDGRAVGSDSSFPDGSAGDAFLRDAFAQDAFREDAFVQDAFVAVDGHFEPDAALPVELRDGDWRLEIALLGDNPLPFLLRLYIEGDRSPSLNAIQHYCDGVPCHEVEGGRYRAVDETTNDIELVIDGERVMLDVFGGLRITDQASPFGEGFDLTDLSVDGRLVAPDRVCGVADMRLIASDGGVFELPGLPLRMQYVGDWDDAAPDLNGILGCGEEE